jgi:hypothetical protein
MTTWTIMVYISADNLLANFAIESLKQLRDAAGKGLPDSASDNICVVSELDDSQQPHARLYFFDGNAKKQATSIEESRIKEKEIAKLELKTICNVDMTRPGTLTEFINFACERSRTEHYCLVLWGHGIELLLDEDRRFGATEKPVRRYLSIGDLRNGLLDTNLVKRRVQGNPEAHLDIVVFDACSMSMVELASELAGCADFMVASQEDVPDASFPYEKILLELRNHGIGNNVREVCKKIPELYSVAFEDYVATPNTGVKGITLSSLDLGKTHDITEALKILARALSAASSELSLRMLVLAARKKAQDFVFGLLVDLYDFCECLEVELKQAHHNSPNLLSACAGVRRVLELDQNGIVVVNHTNEEPRRSHGLSIYFPYKDDDKTDEAEIQFAKGTGRQPLKGTGRKPLKERIMRIQELEADFASLNQFGETEWMEFIRHGWSMIMAKGAPFELDRYYSAEQVAQNLLSDPKPPKILSMPPGSDLGRTG